MSSKDLHNSILPFMAFDTQPIVTATDTLGGVADLRTFRSVEFALAVGTLVDGEFTLVLLDGDLANGSDAVEVSPEFLIGTVASTNIQISNQVTSIGYIGSKRFVTPKVVSVGGTVNAVVSVIGIADSPLSSPFPRV